MKPIKHILEAITFHKLRIIACLLPRPLAMILGRFLGSFVSFLGIRKEIALENLRMAFPQLPKSEMNRIFSRLYRNIGEFTIMFLRNDTPERIGATIDGEENILKAHKTGKGTIIVLAHLGNWEMMGRCFARYSFKSYVVAKPMGNPMTEKVIMKQREKAGLNVIYQKNALPQIVRAIKENNFVGVLIDQDVGAEGIFPNFFGQPASTAPTIAALAQKYKCNVLPAHLIKQPDNKYKLTAEEPFELIETGDNEKDILANTQLYSDYLEGLIKAYPEQWFGWLHRRWKTKQNR